MNVLFVSVWFPWPLDTGARLRVHYLLRALSQVHPVDLVSFRSPAEDESFVAVLADWGVTTHLVRRDPFAQDQRRARTGYFSLQPRDLLATYSQEMAQQIIELGRHKSYDLVVGSFTHGARYAFLVGQVPRLFEEHNFLTGWMKERYTAAHGAGQRLRRWLTWQKCRRYERWLYPQFDAVTMVSERDRLALEATVPAVAGRVTVIANGVDVDRNHPGLAVPQPDTLVFNGALTYTANADAMRYFVTGIMPVIQATRPAVRLSVTGRCDGVDLTGLTGHPAVHLTGFLDDVRPTVAGSWVCVVPLRFGGGTRLKILEAMALGTPVVATSKGAEGLDVRHEHDLLLADTPADFARQTLRLLGDPALRDRLAHNGRTLVETHYSWERIGQAFVQVAEQTAAQGRH